MSEQLNIAEFTRRAADKTGFVREKYTESSLPTNFSNFIAVPFFGDQKHEFVMATMLLHRLKDSMPNRYFILCGWPGHGGFFPYVNEYWGIRDEGALKCMLPKAWAFDNQDKRALFFHQQLNRFFETLAPETFSALYDNGLTKKFFDKFKYVVYSLPPQPGVKQQTAKLLQQHPGRKIFIKPTYKVRSWRRGRLESLPCKIEFWERLTEQLLDGGFVPVVQQDATTYDLSAKYSGKALFFGYMKILEQFALMRSCVVVDIFSGLSRLALAARAPFLVLTERQLQIDGKEYEIDDLCGGQIPHSYIFSFAAMLDGRDYINLVDLTMSRIRDFVPTVDPNHLPSTSQSSTVVPYMLVKEHKAKRFGTKFFKIQRVNNY